MFFYIADASGPHGIPMRIHVLRDLLRVDYLPHLRGTVSRMSLLRNRIWWFQSVGARRAEKSRLLVRRTLRRANRLTLHERWSSLRRLRQRYTALRGNVQTSWLLQRKAMECLGRMRCLDKCFPEGIGRADWWYESTEQRVWDPLFLHAHLLEPVALAGSARFTDQTRALYKAHRLRHTRLMKGLGRLDWAMVYSRRKGPVFTKGLLTRRLRRWRRHIEQTTPPIVVKNAPCLYVVQRPKAAIKALAPESARPRRSWL